MNRRAFLLTVSVGAAAGTTSVPAPSAPKPKEPFHLVGPHERTAEWDAWAKKSQK